MECPRCRTRMVPDPDAGREYCTTCPRYALPCDTAADVERHEAERLRVLVLLDAALDQMNEWRQYDRAVIAEMEARMGQTIETTGCPKCGSTMYKTIETDDQGNPTSATQFVCQGCGHVM
ncbi:hypothetical protein SEA_HFRANCETTE_29 [Streptomyces phage HFrancette]|uniref:Uncharacterized protein n=6 Tax=Ignaciovirus TaxID=3152509 RepID=A0A7D5JPA9_9CAUD|nr:hypothetical protein QEN60_gp29 [Streptomyces phage Ignacio]YP_010756207.1 hypothetical protein QEN61_gp29 [Streptomyces phage Eklok]YP_010756264.1 hypothetical protein QEN62_gp28 [Streptomyces phage AxeJC]YP_010756380.1 hypothetical protein QEN64_gp29 [Streptomyces phage HFrancette]YP_010756439.1 hypothetical protein QEN65_gp29 [Streptomyces phage Cumberbatch]YP_010756497.1 hypothetical protein QEN66_gp28 [Streptomyces phage Piccadilly]YP_010756555.1 hypothetical protein QEN67_gp28 [Strep